MIAGKKNSISMILLMRTVTIDDDVQRFSGHESPKGSDTWLRDRL